MPFKRKVSADLVVAMLRNVKANGEPYTYTEVGDALGLTRERVRQIAKEALGETGRGNRIPAIKSIRDTERLAQRTFPKGGSFVRMIRRWLWAIEHGYCCVCHGCLPIVKMSKSGCGKYRNQNRCKSCLAEYQRLRYQTPQGREYQKRYTKEHPEVVRRAQQKYQHQNREQLSAKRRERYANDPEFRERCKRIWRESKLRRKAKSSEHPVNGAKV